MGWSEWVLVGTKGAKRSTNQNISAYRAAFGLRHVVGGYVAAVAGSGALIGAVARAGTAARKCLGKCWQVFGGLSDGRSKS